jgi:hypothetical protein
MACYICDYPSVLKCRQCGKSVCGRHYDYSDGRCTACHAVLFPKPEATNTHKPAATVVETKPAAAPVTKPMLPKAKKGRK